MRWGRSRHHAHTLNFLGITQHVSDAYLDAERTLTDALDLYRELGHRLGQAEALNNLGDVHAVSHPAQARACHDQALEIARTTSAVLYLRIGSPHAERVSETPRFHGL